MTHTNNMYYGYHQTAKKLIEGGHCVFYEFVEKYKNISPSLVLYFDNHIPMPIRQHKWLDYKKYLENIPIKN